jgi:hypothetical protein
MEYNVWHEKFEARKKKDILEHKRGINAFMEQMNEGMNELR